MNTTPTQIPEPTSPTEVVVGKRDGQAVVAARMDDDDAPWAMQYPASCFQWSSWRQLCGGLTDIRVVDVPELAAEINRLTDRVADLEAAAIYAEGVHQGEMASQRARLEARIAELEEDKPEPGPWLRGDELEAIMPTLKEGDVVEVEYMGHTETGELWADRGLLMLRAITVRTFTGKPGPCVDALRIIERAPEPEPVPGADIPDEVVAAAHKAYWDHYAGASSVGPNGDPTAVRLALAAADAKRAELAGGEQA